MGKSKQFGMIMPPEGRARLERLADLTGMSMGGTVLVALECLEQSFAETEAGPEVETGTGLRHYSVSPPLPAGRDVVLKVDGRDFAVTVVPS